MHHHIYVLKMTESFELLCLQIFNQSPRQWSFFDKFLLTYIIRIIRVSDESAGDVLYTRLCYQIHVLLCNCIYMYQVIYFIRSGWIVFCSHMISFQFPFVVSVDLESYMMTHLNYHSLIPHATSTSTACNF